MRTELRGTTGEPPPQVGGLEDGRIGYTLVSAVRA
jgi:hypothetical protein